MIDKSALRTVFINFIDSLPNSAFQSVRSVSKVSKDKISNSGYDIYTHELSCKVDDDEYVLYTEVKDASGFQKHTELWLRNGALHRDNHLPAETTEKIDIDFGSTIKECFFLSGEQYNP